MGAQGDVMTHLLLPTPPPQPADEAGHVNLEDLRQQLTGHLAFCLVVAGAVMAWAVLPIRPLNTAVFGLGLGLAGVGGAVQQLNRQHPRLARHTLVWGITALLPLAIWLIDAAWLPFLGLLVTFANAFLVRNSSWLTAVTVGTLIIRLNQIDPSRDYAAPAIMIALLIGAGLSWLVTNTLFTALQWARVMQRRADELLEEAQKNQAELKRTLKSLELANYQIERSNQELEIARAHAEEARRMKEQFAANISHELRTPLNLIVGFSEMMYFSPEVYGDVMWSATLRRDIYQIHRSSVHLLEMIDDILDLSRFEMSTFTLNKETVNIEPLLQSAVEIASALLRGRPVELTLLIEPGLPALHIDTTRVRQVVLNLLSNAQRFTTQGAIRVKAERARDEVVISVSDTGVGIPPDKLSRVFEEFYQVDGSLRRNHEGAGLGLAICKRLVEAHDGRIWVESEVGRGSTFYVALPIPGARPPIARPKRVNPLKEPSLEKYPHVLVIDPDPTVTALISRHVDGYEFLHLPDEDRLNEHIALENARVVIRNTPPDRASRSDQLVCRLGGVPIIECSLPSHAWIASALGVTACLTKPITLEQLSRTVGQLAPCREVLIVDDDRGFGELVERMLTASGMVGEVRHAYDGEQALRAIRERRPDVILTDLAMPVMDGFEMLSQLRHMPEADGIPVILLTVTSYAEDALRYHPGRLTVTRDIGFQPFETLSCLQSLLDSLCSAPAQSSNRTNLGQNAQHIVPPDGLEQVARRPQ